MTKDATLFSANGMSSSASSWAVCHSFLQYTTPEKYASLTSFLSPQDREKLHSLPSTYHTSPAFGWDFAAEVLPHIHHSWFTPFLRTLSPQDLTIFLSALTDIQRKGLKKTLLFSEQHTASPDVDLGLVRKFLYQKLLSALLDKEVLPICCLPASSLNNLLTFDFLFLIRLIDHLGIHDLATEVKQIIETAKLKQIYASLSSEQTAYLKAMLQKKEPVTFTRMALNNWNGDKESLQGALHQRGINRLAKALTFQDPSLLWHLSHRFDAARGATLSKLYNANNTASKHATSAAGSIEMNALLVHQVEDLVYYLQHPQPSSHT